MVFLEADLPHVNQTAYRRSVSCANAVFGNCQVSARWKQGVDMFVRLAEGFRLGRIFCAIREAVYGIGVNGKI